jgi:hypothetical protein
VRTTVFAKFCRLMENTRLAVRQVLGWERCEWGKMRVHLVVYEMKIEIAVSVQNSTDVWRPAEIEFKITRQS